MIRQYINTIALTLALAMVLFFTVNRDVGSNKVTINNPSVTLSFNFQLVKMETNELFTIHSSVSIIRFNDHTVYKIPYTSTVSNMARDKHSDAITEKIIKVETKYNYLICNNKSKLGYMFDSLTAAKGITTNIDSFKISRLYKNFSVYKKSDRKLVEKSLSPSGKILLEKYVFNDKKDASYFDSMYYYFNKDYVDIKYAFSKELDSAKHSKLYKVRFIYNKITKGNHGLDIPRREYSFEMKKKEAFKDKELTKFVAAFKSKESVLYKGN